MTWIRCIDQEPPQAVEVLAYFPDTKEVRTAQNEGGYWYDSSGTVICDPKQYPRPAIAASHWMAMPSPPQPGS